MDIIIPPGIRIGTATTPPVPTLAALQQIYRRIPAPAAKIKQPGKAPDPTVLYR